MTYTWLKLHHEIISDIKLRKFTPAEKWAWITLLVLASQSKERGIIKADDEDIADACEFNTTQDWLYYRDKLVSKGMIEIFPSGLKILNWEKRQHEFPSNKPEATKERKRRQRAKLKENVTNVTSMSRVCHDIDLDPDSDPEPDSKNIQSTLPLSKNAHKTENQENAEGGREKAALLKKEEPKPQVMNPLAALEKKTKTEFLKFCKQHYRQHNDGKELSLAQEYAKKYFDELWELYENTTGLQVDLEPEIKTEELAIAICEKYPCEEWPNWVLKTVGVNSKYFNQYEHWYMSSNK
jgi:hypothetical protein